MIRSDFHVHTMFADGKNTPEEMVLAAIGKGMTTIGFSEHAHTPFDAEYCLSKAGTAAYRAEIARLREFYKNDIEILCGIELDADSSDSPDPYDYAIGSVHYLAVGGVLYSVDLSPEETERCVQKAFGGDYNAFAEAYFEKVVLLFERCHPQIIGHFDLLTKFRETGVCPTETSPRYRAAWHGALSALAGKAVMEINTGAVSKGYRKTPYPSEEILRAWHALGGGILLSGDAHSKEGLAAGFDALVPQLRALGFSHAGFTDAAGKEHRQYGPANC